MATWAGWQAQLLKAASVPDSPGNEAFLGDWHDSANSNCKNNPVDISRAATGATNCHKLTATRTAKNYASHAQAATAFNRELRSGNFPHLLAALKSGDPYNASDPHNVIADLIVWGSVAFAFMLQQNYGPPSGGGGGGGGGSKSVRAHSGWADLRHSINHNMPRALNKSNRNVRAALRSLSHGRKVRA